MDADLLSEGELDPLLWALFWGAIEAVVQKRVGWEEDLEWIEECSRDEGGFGWVVGGLRRQPEKTRDLVLAWIETQREAA